MVELDADLGGEPFHAGVDRRQRLLRQRLVAGHPVEEHQALRSIYNSSCIMTATRGAVNRSEIELELPEREEDALAERRVGLDDVQQHLDRRLGPDRERQLLQPLAGLGAG